MQVATVDSYSAVEQIDLQLAKSNHWGEHGRLIEETGAGLAPRSLCPTPGP
jgi:hypothetical protein